MTEEEIEAAEALLEFEFEDPSHLELALTHSSIVDARGDSNERLEFLGDAIMGAVVCEYLYRNYGDLMEGELTKIKSVVVSRRTCAVVAEDLDLGALLRMGKGMAGRQGPPQSVLAGLFESIIGAIHLDGGYEAARDWILDQMDELIREAAGSGHQHNFKSVLQQLMQQEYEQAPMYVVLDEQGPDHAKCFQVCVQVDGRRFEACWAPSKKQAEQDAALNALLEMGHAYRNQRGDVRLADVQF